MTHSIKVQSIIALSKMNCIFVLLIVHLIRLILLMLFNPPSNRRTLREDPTPSSTHNSRQLSVITSTKQSYLCFMSQNASQGCRELPLLQHGTYAHRVHPRGRSEPSAAFSVSIGPQNVHEDNMTFSLEYVIPPLNLYNVKLQFHFLPKSEA